VRIELPFPDKALWPNGRPHHMAKAREVKKHRSWAHTATLEALQHEGAGSLRSGSLALLIEVHAKPKGPLPDPDNCVAAAKSMIDGIADALGLNDRDFAAPRVAFSEQRDGKFFVVLG
jgi:crossover junction endodeoxyribonuclease RusA